jgi:predicted nucleotidyltransferase
MKTFEEIKEILKKQKPFLMEKYGVKEIGVFGSYVKGEQKDKSDLDVLVEFGRSIGFFEFLELEEYLENTIGVKVELVTKRALKPKIGEYILSEVVNI